MKIFNFLILLCFSTNAAASVYDLTELCDPTVGRRVEFSNATQIKVVTLLKGIKEESKEWKDFSESDMFYWLSLVSASSLPKYAKTYDALGCSASYKAVLTSIDKNETIKYLDIWMTCLNAAYQNEPPPIADEMKNCFLSEKK